MNNALNAKLSKLIYALASDDLEYLSKAGAFDRLLLLVRELYRMLDETEGLKQLVFRLYYGKHYGLIKLDAASPNDDAGIEVETLDGLFAYRRAYRKLRQAFVGRA